MNERVGSLIENAILQTVPHKKYVFHLHSKIKYETTQGAADLIMLHLTVTLTLPLFLLLRIAMLPIFL